MITNSQGFRMDRDIEFPKKKQRILLIGSSLTWGPYVENHDTYPDLLNKAYPKKECINGGKIGRTIVNDPSAFENHYRYCEPDITFLQVSSFDIETSLSFIQNMYLEKPIEPTVTEVKFIKAVINE